MMENFEKNEFDKGFKASVKILKILEMAELPPEEFIYALPFLIASVSMLADNSEKFLNDLFKMVNHLLKGGGKNG